MAEPDVTFGFNHDNPVDEPWEFQGAQPAERDGWKVIEPATDLVVFTGGGILGTLPTPTTTSGHRDATIRPSTTSYVIPQTYVEKEQMYITQAGKNTNRYVFGVRVDGLMTSDLYLEAWDDNSFSTTDLEILTGTAESSNQSFVNAIRTTYNEPPWTSGTEERDTGWNGNASEGAFLRGTEHRIGLNNTSQIQDSTVYYNIYIRLETDCSTFHVFPVLGFRYLYT